MVEVELTSYSTLALQSETIAVVEISGGKQIFIASLRITAVVLDLIVASSTEQTIDGCIMPFANIIALFLSQSFAFCNITIRFCFLNMEIWTHLERERA